MILSVDFQGDFAREGGSNYKSRPCVEFVKGTLVPFLLEHRASIAEIVSDYRLPRPGDSNACCVPGTEWFESEISEQVKRAGRWIKCMNSPEWVRDNGGDGSKEPGLPYPNTKLFSEWLVEVAGPPDRADEVILIGLTLDCCVLCTAQSLAHRAYRVRYLVEGVDCYSGDSKEKEFLLESAAMNWGKPITWLELSKIKQFHS